LGEAYWNVGMEEIHDQVSQRIEELARLIQVQRISLSVNRYIWIVSWY